MQVQWKTVLEKFLFIEELQLITEKGMRELSVHHLATPNGFSNNSLHQKREKKHS